MTLVAACSSSGDPTAAAGDSCASDMDCIIVTGDCAECGELCGDRASSSAARAAACKDAPRVKCPVSTCTDAFSRLATCNREPQTAGEPLLASGKCIFKKAANLIRSAYSTACTAAEDCVAVNTTFACASCGRPADFAINKSDANRFGNDFAARFGKFTCEPQPCIGYVPPAKPLCTNQVCTLPPQ